ncbi:energy transducer TonB [Geothrix fuzhouensis]|uniref:energy transducer TonB n=1 Tax=Geothrix fuzhouensis TaxID=2966451 RepID=UPI0021479A3F|nr:energy transducer TonB [Geothrix fuzhouensis]
MTSKCLPLGLLAPCLLMAGQAVTSTPEMGFALIQRWAGPGATQQGFTREQLEAFLADRQADLGAGRQPKWSAWLKGLEASSHPNLKAWALARRVEAGDYAAYPALQEALIAHLLGISRPGSGRDDRILTDPPTAALRGFLMPETLRLDHESVFWRSLRKTLQTTPDWNLDGGMYAIWCFGTHPDQKDLILELAARADAHPTVRNQASDPWNDPRFWIVLDWAIAWGTEADLGAIRSALKQGLPRAAFDRAIQPLEAIPGFFTTKPPVLLETRQIPYPPAGTPPSNSVSLPPTLPTTFDFSQIRVLHQPPPPSYPHEARARKMMTNLVLEIVVDPEGKPVSCHPRPGPWLGFFAPVGVAYGLRWQFHPAKLNGVPQTTRFRLTMPFRLRI